MKFSTLNKKKELDNSFRLTGDTTGSEISFDIHDNKKKVTIRTGSYFSRQEIFNAAMILLKLAIEMEDLS